jgi:hypothetical protein
MQCLPGLIFEEYQLREAIEIGFVVNPASDPTMHDLDGQGLSGLG